jgi:hypothetical protein
MGVAVIALLDAIAKPDGSRYSDDQPFRVDTWNELL